MAKPEPGNSPFEARLTGAQALARAVLDSCSRTVVICPEYFLSQIYGVLKGRSDQDRGFFLCGPARGKIPVQAAFRSAMEGCPSVFLCGDGDGHHVRKAARQLGRLDIPGGLVLVGEVSLDSPVQSRDKTGGLGQIPEPGRPGEIYRFYRQAAGLASAHRCLVCLRVADMLWAEEETLVWDGSRGRQALICPDCQYRIVVAAVREILAANDIAVTAMACQGLGLYEFCEVGSSLPSPVPGCGGLGIWIETSACDLVVYVGDGGMGLDEKVRDLSVERIFHCRPFCGENLASMIQKAMAWQGMSAVFACPPSKAGVSVRF